MLGLISQRCGYEPPGPMLVAVVIIPIATISSLSFSVLLGTRI